MVTISALAATQGTEGQLQAHIRMGMNTGISTEQMKSVFDTIEKLVSKEQAENARAVFSNMKK